MTDNAPVRVAIVGAGPAGLYAAGHLLDNRDFQVEIDFIERLPTPWGLVRSGVAPDHAEKKRIVDRLFDFTLRDPRVRFFGNIAVGEHVTTDELAQWYDAVIFAHGAGSHNALGIEGETLDGVWGAREFVQFYNGHPDQAHLHFDVSHPRAVIVGNGNVALDIARILTTDVAALAQTDIADHALQALRNSRIEEVVVMGRRDLEFAAFNNPELEEFDREGAADIAVRGGLVPPRSQLEPLAAWRAHRRFEIMRALTARPRRGGGKRIVFHFLATPVALRGNGRVKQVDYVTNSALRSGGTVSYKAGTEVETLPAGLVLLACGYRGSPLAGLPFDAESGVVPNRAGRVLGKDGALSGIYVTGWIKRGCRGIIGSNRWCADETTKGLLEDYRAGRLAAGALQRDELCDLLTRRNPDVVMFDHWRAIDRAERLAGRGAGRPRVKLTRTDALLSAAHGPSRRIAARSAEPTAGTVS